MIKFTYALILTVYFLLFTRFSTYENSCINLSILIGIVVALNILLVNLVTI
jgi:hypothetical protein